MARHLPKDHPFPYCLVCESHLYMLTSANETATFYHILSSIVNRAHSPLRFLRPQPLHLHGSQPSLFFPCIQCISWFPISLSSIHRFRSRDISRVEHVETCRVLYWIIDRVHHSYTANLIQKGLFYHFDDDFGNSILNPSTPVS